MFKLYERVKTGDGDYGVIVSLINNPGKHVLYAVLQAGQKVTWWTEYGLKDDFQDEDDDDV